MMRLDVKFSFKLLLLLEKTAYLLVYHGSRDPRPRQEMLWLAKQVRQKLADHLVIAQEREQGRTVLTKPLPPVVYTAALELAPLSLESAIAQLLPKIHHKGLTQLQVIPLFLLPGVHVREDIPNAISHGQEQAQEPVTITISPYFGSLPSIRQQLQQHCPIPASAKIVVSHGSRRQGGNQPIVELAQQLGASPAYWLVSPTLTETVEAMVAQGNQEIAILPYFLFPGGITDAIAQQVQSLQTQFPKVTFHLGTPLNHCFSLADLIVNEIIV